MAKSRKKAGEKNIQLKVFINQENIIAKRQFH
jgi:hypothetical protein